MFIYLIICLIIILLSLPLLLLSSAVNIVPFLVYALKMKNQLGWLAFVPGLNYFAVSSGFKDKFPIFGSFALPNGTVAGIVYLLYFIVISFIWAPLSTFLGTISFGLLLIVLVPIAWVINAVGWILVYALLRNIADRHSENTSTNAVIALVLVLLDLFVTRGFAWPIYILVMAFMPAVETKAEPIEEAVEAPAAIAE